MNDERDLLAVTGATLIDGTGGPLVERSVLLIDGDRIVAAGDLSLEIPERATRLPADGKYIIPGLIDASAWLIEGTVPMVLIRHEEHYAELAIEAAQLALKNGVTTVFDGWGPRDELIRARDAIETGHAAGSRIRLCGNWVGLGGPFSSDIRQPYRAAVYESFAARVDAQWECNVGPKLMAMSPEQVRLEIRTYLQSGVNYLNYSLSDHHIGALRFILFSPRVQRVLVEEAHAAGLPVCGFRPATGEAIHIGLEAGIDIIKIPELSVFAPLSEDTVRLIAERKVPCVIEAVTKRGLDRLGQSAASGSLIEIMRTNQHALVRAGIPILLGTGSFVASSDDTAAMAFFATADSTKALGDGHFVWFEAMEELGVKPMAMLLAATRDPARAFRIDSELGTLEPGKIADFLILDRNPLAKAANYRSLNTVIKDGRVVERDQLPTKRILTSAS